MRKMVLAKLRRRHFDLVYSNTITNGSIVNALCGPTRRVLTHVHELETMIRRYGSENLSSVLRQSRRFIACADAVKANLVTNHGVDPRLIDVVHEFVHVSEVKTSPTDRAQILDRLGVPPQSLIVGSSGTTDWRKGPDLFIQMASASVRMRPDMPIAFLWIGGDGPGSVRFSELMHDANRMGIGDRIYFLGSRDDASRLFGVCDVFALTSREDPFPLVCLEAAAVGIPVVCFDDAGGEPEFVRNDCGFVVPYLDVGEMARRLVELLERPVLRRQMGTKAADRVRQNHTVPIGAQKVLDSIAKTMRD
jgi:glycosyltransferase involved in cell wall biosynthesis